MRLDAYVRGSTEEQEITLDAQESRIRQYHALYGCERDTGFELGEILVERGESAKNLNRPELVRALKRMDIGKSDGLIITKLDRLTRKLRDWQDLVDLYFGEKAGKKLIAIDNQVNTFTATGRMMLNMIVLMAQWELETISERTVDGLRRKIAKGERCGGVRYGHQLDPSHPARSKKTGAINGLKVDAREQEAIAVMHQCRKEGATLRAIAWELGRLGFKTKSGRSKWAPQTIHRILNRKA